jgi:hypothetical protein
MEVYVLVYLSDRAEVANFTRRSDLIEEILVVNDGGDVILWQCLALGAGNGSI